MSVEKKMRIASAETTAEKTAEKTVRFVSMSDKHTFDAPLSLVLKSSRLAQMLPVEEHDLESDDDDDDDDEDVEVSVYNQNGPCLRMAFAFLKFHQDVPYEPVPKPIAHTRFTDLVPCEFDRVRTCTCTVPCEFDRVRTCMCTVPCEFTASQLTLACLRGVQNFMQSVAMSTEMTLLDLIRTAEYLQLPDLLDLAIVKVGPLLFRTLLPYNVA
jgi:hypothetical protein